MRPLTPIHIGHCDLISRFSDFTFNLDTIFSYFFQIMSEYDLTFDPNIPNFTVQ